MPKTLPLVILACSCLLTGCQDSATDSSTPAATADSEKDSEPANNLVPEGKPGQVLQHTVFFKFKEGTSDEGAQEVADAFAALPGKISVIKDFKWGKNNSPEEFDDGYTHCFLLTFEKNTDLAEYIVHPDHRAFGDVLGKYRDGVFVIDYWTDPSAAGIENELKHCVFFKFKDDASEEDVTAIEEAFAALPGKIDTIKTFEWGTNISLENKDDGFTHCFIVTFDSDAGRKAYLPHEAHEEFVELLKPSLDKVRVLDFFVEPPADSPAAEESSDGESTKE